MLSSGFPEWRVRRGKWAFCADRRPATRPRGANRRDEDPAQSRACDWTGSSGCSGPSGRGRTIARPVGALSLHQLAVSCRGRGSCATHRGRAG